MMHAHADDMTMRVEPYQHRTYEQLVGDIERPRREV